MKKRKNLNIWLPMLMFLLLMVSTAMAEIIYVDADANGLNDGSSWADAYNYLQDALAVALSGDEIWVAQGIYKPDQGIGITPGGRMATFQLINGVAIRGGYAGFGEPDPNARDIDTYESILSGDLDSDDVEVNDPCDLWNEPSRAENCYHVVTGSGTEETAVLDGFTVTAGNAFKRPWQPMMPTPNNWGGGMYIEAGSPTLVNCMFRGNCAERYGGGIYNKDLNGDCSPTLTNCTFSGNSARSKDGWAGSGGGMYNAGSSPMVINCTFTGNTGYYGGGMRNEGASPIVLNCTLSGNSAGWGGGMRNSWGSSPIVTGCLFIGNSASGDGGGMLSSDSSPTVGSCIFTGNSAGERGGGMVNFAHSNFSLSNCIFTGNSAADGGGIYSSYSSLALTSSTFAGNSGTNGSALACDSFLQNHPSSVELANCILWDGGDEIWNNDGSEITISYSDVQGGETGVYDPYQGLVWGEGNIDDDPCFADANNGDYHLLEDSPCIDAGDPNYAAEPNETDLDGKPRVIGRRIDMGAYEFNHIPVADAGPNQTVEAEGAFGARVTLDGSGSSDADSAPGTNDDIVCFDWYKVDACDPNFEDFLASGEIIDCNLPLGEHIIILEVIDKAGAFDTNEVTIIVQDTTPPDFTLSVTPTTLWPANHKMVLITPSWTASDICDTSPEVSLVSITMDEDDEAKGSGHTTLNIQIGDDGAIYLRAERSGTGSGRIYTITYQAVDDSGNAAVARATVTVPHNQR